MAVPHGAFGGVAALRVTASLHAVATAPLRSAVSYQVMASRTSSHSPPGAWTVNVALPLPGTLTGPLPVPHQPMRCSFQALDWRSSTLYIGAIVPFSNPPLKLSDV